MAVVLRRNKDEDEIDRRGATLSTLERVAWRLCNARATCIAHLEVDSNRFTYIRQVAIHSTMSGYLKIRALLLFLCLWILILVSRLFMSLITYSTLISLGKTRLARVGAEQRADEKLGVAERCRALGALCTSFLSYYRLFNLKVDNKQRLECREEQYSKQVQC